MPVERRGQVTDVGRGQPETGGAPIPNGRRQPSFSGTSRMTRECQVRICERLGVKFPGPTRQSMLAFSRELDVQYKTAFVLAHKLREAMASNMKALRIGGEGRVAEIDGAYFGGHVRPENLAADRVDRRLAENQSDKRQVVVVMRERDGRTLVQVVPAEEAAVPVIRQRIAKGTVLHADESPAWNKLHAGFAMQRINHQDGYSIDGACTNGGESYFSRLRRGELGHHHHIAGPYLLRYAQEAAWREDNRR